MYLLITLTLLEHDRMVIQERGLYDIQWDNNVKFRVQSQPVAFI